jgi:hypothetical protein
MSTYTIPGHGAPRPGHPSNDPSVPDAVRPHTTSTAEADLRTPDAPLWMTLALATCIGFGVTLFIFALLYVRDLRMLAEMPGVLWDFLCGVPRADGAALPILLGLSTLSFMGAAVVWTGRALLRLSPRKTTSL